MRFGGAALLFGCGLAACGGQSRSHELRSVDAGSAGMGGAGTSASGGAGMGASGGAGMSASGGAPALEYTGAVVATTSTLNGESDTHSVFAAFGKGGTLDLDACADCCCIHGLALPLPEKPPDAGAIELSTFASGELLATLTPDLGVIIRDWELGTWGIGGLGDYRPLESASWEEREALFVSAVGNEVHAFSGQLRTGLALLDVEPAIGAETVIIQRDQGFSIQWEPEAREERVDLLLSHASNETGVNACICSALDSRGQLRVSPDVLSAFGTDGSGTIQLSRVVVSTTTSDNASITLVGQVQRAGSVEFR